MSISGAPPITRQARLALTRTAVACCVALAITACGAPTKGKHPAAGSTICIPKALDAVARSLKVARGAIATAGSTGNNGSPQCTFRTRIAGSARVEVIANVDDGPQPYFILERTIVEAQQVFTPKRLVPAPVNVPGLGLEASWFPAETERWLMATDGYRLITASIRWPGAAEQRKIALATAVIRPYLHTPHGKAAEKVINGYPSGG